MIKIIVQVEVRLIFKLYVQSLPPLSCGENYFFGGIFAHRRFILKAKIGM